MKKFSLTQIKAFDNGNNNLNDFELCEIKLLQLDCVAYSVGVNGINGGLFFSNLTGGYYVITNRSSLLFRLI